MGRPSAPVRDEAGFSLVETVVALAILMLIVPAMMGALFISVTAGKRQQVRSVATQLVLSGAEAVKADAFDPLCPQYATAGTVIPANWSVTTSCVAVAGQPVAYPLQTVTIAVQSPPGPGALTTSIVLVKSNRS